MVKLQDDNVYARVILEIVGKPKEYVTESLAEHIKKVKENFDVKKEKIEKPEEQEGFFSSFAELEIIFKKPIDLVYFCFDYMPSSIEILEPEYFKLKNNEFSNYLNDVQSRLHTINTAAIRLKDANTHLVKNTAVLLRNFIVVLLAQKPRKIKELTPLLGVREDDIEKVLNVLIKEGKVKKQNDLYLVQKKQK